MSWRGFFRLLGWAFVALLAYSAWEGFTSARRDQAKVDAARTAIRVRMPVDLSRAGEYRGALRETFLNSHGAVAEVLLRPPLAGEEALQKAIAGVAGTVAIVGDYGQVMAEQPLQDALYVSWLNRPGGQQEKALCLAGWAGAYGNYTLVVTVTQPAAGLAGRAQELEGRYLLCGQEELPALIGRGLGYVSSAGALGLAGLLVRGIIKRRRADAAAAGGGHD